MGRTAFSLRYFLFDDLEDPGIHCHHLGQYFMADAIARRKARILIGRIFEPAHRMLLAKGNELFLFGEQKGAHDIVVLMRHEAPFSMHAGEEIPFDRIIERVAGRNRTGKGLEPGVAGCPPEGFLALAGWDHAVAAAFDDLEVVFFSELIDERFLLPGKVVAVIEERQGDVLGLAQRQRQRHAIDAARAGHEDVATRFFQPIELVRLQSNKP